MPHPKLTANRALRTTGASAAALALLALPLAGPAVAVTSSDPVLDDVDLLGEPEEEEEAAEDSLLTRVLEIADRVEAPVEDDGAAAPAPSDSTMEPAGSNYEPVTEPSPAPAPAQSTQASTTDGSTTSPPPPPAFDRNGPRLQGWASHTGTAFDPAQSPLVAGPLTVPAPQFADPAAVQALAGVAKDGWAAVSNWTPAGVGLDPYTPTQWPLAVAAGLLLLVGGGHVLRLYDESWKAAAQPSSTTP